MDHLPSARIVADVALPGPVPLWTHPEWARRHPWLAQGITGRGPDAPPFDLSLFGDGRARPALDRWDALLNGVGAASGVHARQVHGAAVRHHGPVPPGLFVAEPCDGHLTRSVGLLLGVTVADCVPVTLVDPGTRAVSVLHAGWRGTAAGMVAAGVDAFRDRLGVAPRGLEAHLGPAICGACYEVGPEVHGALGLDEPSGPTPVDLRRVLVRDLARCGVDVDRITVSSWCTRCGDSPFFSHRGGDPERQVAWAARLR